MNPSIFFSPIARKRWKRFRNRKRAWYALWGLAGLYAIGLSAHLICNDRPLLLRFEGRWHVPFLRFYPEDTFTGSGLMTRPDYKRLRAHPVFAEHREHFMLFAPVPFSPFESIDPERLSDRVRLTLDLHPERRTAGIHVDRDLALSRPLAAEPFFGTPDVGMAGRSLDAYWRIPESLREALERRFLNREAPALTVLAEPLREALAPTEISLAAFTPRPEPPTVLRLTLREPLPPGASSRRVVFAPSGDPVRGRKDWDSLPDPVRERLQPLVPRGFSEPLPDQPVEINGVRHAAVFHLREIRWPFPPTPGHWMGIDAAGRDVLARVLYGLRIAMTFGILLVAGSYAFGLLAGALQGFFGGRVDIVSQRLIEIWSALPFLYVMILMGSIYGRGFGLLLVCYGLFNWIGISYYVRAEFLRLRRLPFVDAAHTMGIAPLQIIRRHILPNALTPVITFFPFSLVGAIGSLTALDYLGFGLPPPTPSWGQLLHQAQQFRWAWWLILYPSAALFVVMLLGVFVGDGVRDAYDPKPVSRME